MNRRIFFLMPLAVFLILTGYFAVGLTKDPKRLPSMLEGKPVPDFEHFCAQQWYTMESDSAVLREFH